MADPDRYQPPVTIRMEGIVPAEGITEVALQPGQTIARVGNDIVGVATAASPVRAKAITIEDPSASEDISMFFSNAGITISEIRAVLKGSSTPSVTWTVRHGINRSAAGSEVVTGGTTTTSTTTGDDITSFDDPTVVADSFIWIETTAKSGTVDELQITIFYTED